MVMRKYRSIWNIKSQYIWLKNNTGELYFILGRADLHSNFSSLFMDEPDIYKFPTVR